MSLVDVDVVSASVRFLAWLLNMSILAWHICVVGAEDTQCGCYTSPLLAPWPIRLQCSFSSSFCF